MRFFDTAPFYGLGEAERRLGRALAAAGLAESERPVVATKAGRLLTAEPDGSVGVRFDFGYDAARRSLESSLERLGVDRVDIVHIHDPDDHIDEALEGTFPALAALRDEGVIGAVSLGTNSVDTAAVFLERADLDCMLVAGRYTLLDRSAAGLIDACAARGVAYLAAGVFNSGVLARPREGAWYDYGPASAETLARAAAIDDGVSASRRVSEGRGGELRAHQSGGDLGGGRHGRTGRGGREPGRPAHPGTRRTLARTAVTGAHRPAGGPVNLPRIQNWQRFARYACILLPDRPMGGAAIANWQRSAPFWAFSAASSAQAGSVLRNWQRFARYACILLPDRFRWG